MIEIGIYELESKAGQFEDDDGKKRYPQTLRVSMSREDAVAAIAELAMQLKYGDKIIDAHFWGKLSPLDIWKKS